ncbi:hypothetical protein [Martelella endophytica]|uniref:Uncharacterized protein n=1 Tax=Martelella endophytica TaxID=1486262 RepID=A0A0D5LPX6_MAREN|nr:hypothetical protein [Martelella endophytica]AJY45980.1 hypothetical protein TM49_10335 [Martelella endophytica]
MANVPKPPSMEGLKRRIRNHRLEQARGDGFVRERFCLTREDARAKAREWFDSYPKAAYWTEVESWRVVDDGRIEFTMRRLSTAD